MTPSFTKAGAAAWSAPGFPVLHNADLESHEAPDAIMQALRAQLYTPVRWTDTVQGLRGRGATLLLECGPGKVLAGLARRIDRELRCLPVHDPDSLAQAIEATGLQLPMFVSCLIAGILLGNARNLIMKKDELFPGAKIGIALISDISLGMFLVMALMGLQLWELEGLMVFISAVMVFQILLSILFTIFIVFRFMGRDYEATVISAGVGGITLGSTATAIVNMTAVAKQYGAAHRAFIIVPLVAGFFIDLMNALIINFFVGL